MIHFDVKPRMGVLAAFNFPHVLSVKGIKWNHKAKHTIETEVQYKLWEHPGLPKDKFCLPCKSPRPCACEKGKHTSAQRDGPPPAKKQRLDKEGTVAKLAAMLKGTRDCPAFLAGKCRSVRLGKACPFRHQEGVDPFSIHCACAHSPQGRICSNGKTCMYLHLNQADYDYEPAEECALTPHRVRPCRRGRKRRKRWRYPQMRFNSTLGYPGEGPTIATWNARGLAETRKVAAMLRRAKASGWDVLLVQEVKWTEQSESAAERIAHVCEFEMYASRGSSGHQGGSAVFIRRDSATVKVKGKARTDIQGYCAVPVSIEGINARLVSIYVPSEARLQSWFLRELKRKKLLKRDDIVGGDFNCVADPDRDARRDDGTRYDPKHGVMCETILNEVGLGDTFRLYHGEDARDYTRTDTGVQTRLDRIYTRQFNAPWRLTKHEHDHKLLEWSDHSAVVVSVNVAPQRDATPIEEKIDPSIMRDSEIRADIRDLWRQAYAERPATTRESIGYLRAQAWEHAKGIVASYLLQVTGDRRRQAKQKTKADALRNLLGDATRLGSAREAHARIKQLREQLKKERRNRKEPSAWWKYLATLREEVSSKVFFRTFKAKHGSPDISSLHQTKDWDHPETKEVEEVTTPTLIVEELRKYYAWLFQPKPSNNAHPFLDKLRQRQVLKASADKLEKPLEEPEVRKAIRKLAKGKAPGPDRLPAEFYIEFEDLIAADLTEMLLESLDRGVLPKTVRDGNIILIYKKGDTREVRNYRPITLLNLDYKIMSKVLVARLSEVMDEIVSPQQLGFVPGRVITEATHMVKLAQALADEEDEEGILVAADWEKAFDRVSWDYLHEAIDALGFGPRFKEWVGTMYNDYSPPTRRVKANGAYSAPFDVRSGTPQGCPASPLIFLLVAEALTRLVMLDDNIQGVRVGDRTLKLSQFADDTQFLLRGYKDLKKMWEVIHQYEEATGMRANKQKFAGMRLGKTRRSPIPDSSETRPIKFVTGRVDMTLLGVPFWEGRQYETAFWERLYNKVRSKMACWKAQVNLSVFGRSMLANTMVLSRYRYWASCMKIPEETLQAIISDVQNLVWQKDVMFPEGEIGSTLTSRRWLKAGAQYGDRKRDLGIGLLDWEAHVQAIQAKWLLRYRDATRGEWKFLLDRWLARHETGRGGPFTTTPISKLIKSTTQRVSALPTFWKSALKAIRSLGIYKADPRGWTWEDARAHPIWDSPLFDIHNRTLIRTWKQLETKNAEDLFKVDGTEYSDSEILSYFDLNFHQSETGAYWILGKRVSKATILRNWHAIIRAIPDRLAEALRNRDSGPEEIWRYSRQAYAIIQRMGWMGGGIGKHGSGASDPLEVGRPRPPGLGLGHARTNKQVSLSGDTPKWIRAAQTATTPTRSRNAAAKADKLRAVVTEEDTVVYGYPDYRKAQLEVATISTKGVARRSGEKLDINIDHLEKVVRWNGKVLGRAAATYPHPKSWRIGTIDKDLDKVDVKALTTAISLISRVPPSCIAAWVARLGSLPDDLGSRYNCALLTPKDWASHFKNILHRSMWVKAHDDIDKACRCCKHAYENIQHFATCDVLGKLFASFAELVANSGVAILKNYDAFTGTEKERFALFALTPSGPNLDRGWINLHLLLWKYIIYSLTVLQTEGIPLHTHSIWQAAWQRFIWKAEALGEKVKTLHLRAESRGDEPPDSSGKGTAMSPLATFTEDGRLIWTVDLKQKIEKLTGKTNP